MTYASNKSTVKYAGVFLLSMGTFSLAPVLLSWISNLSYGHYKRATIMGLSIMFTNSGGILSTWLWQNGTDKGYLVNLGLASLTILLLIGLEGYLIVQRRWRRSGKMDWKVDELRKLGWSEARIRGYREYRTSHPCRCEFKTSIVLTSISRYFARSLSSTVGDQHPEFELIL